MMELILNFHHEALKVVEKGELDLDLDALFTLPVRERIARAKYVAEEDLAGLDNIDEEIKKQVGQLSGEGGEAVA